LRCTPSRCLAGKLAAFGVTDAGLGCFLISRLRLLTRSAHAALGGVEVGGPRWIENLEIAHHGPRRSRQRLSQS
jgi:hypothetical protein